MRIGQQLELDVNHLFLKQILITTGVAVTAVISLKLSECGPRCGSSLQKDQLTTAAE